jgi:pyruvate/2-oxoglutarate dehydrogenase complex dihydrolipoamide acyltransferase (E2) component
VMEQSVAALPAAFMERTIDLAAVRARAQAVMGDAKVLVTPVDLLIAAVARAARALPRFNAFVTRDYQLHLFERVNVGVAIDVEGDLYVAVVRDAAEKSVAELAKELHTMQYLALRRRLGVEQLSGGTITVTALIGRGVQRFQAIPYPEQAAIVSLAADAAESSTAALGLVFDHRIANGSQAAAFLGAISDSLGDVS